MIGRINKIETLSFLDGPGARIVIFMQGCPMRCIYCHNPETWEIEEGQEYTSKELFDFIIKYKNYFNNGGGVTFSGGEPLLQCEFLIEVSKLLKEEHINIALDTSGVGNCYEELLDLVDLVILDIKELDENKYKSITGNSIKEFNDFLKIVQEKKKKIWIRSVIVPGINDNIDYIYRLKEYLKTIKNIEKIELLPYHTLGVSKYKELNIDYKLKNVKSMDSIKCEDLYKKLIE